MPQSDHSAIGHLAKSVQRLFSVLERVNPEVIREDEAAYGSTFGEDLTVARQGLENMLRVLGISVPLENPNGMEGRGLWCASKSIHTFFRVLKWEMYMWREE